MPAQPAAPKPEKPAFAAADAIRLGLGAAS